MNFTNYIKIKPSISIKTIAHDIFTKKDPEEFKPNGSQIFYGYQGEGKTISMVHYLLKLKQNYPKSIIVTNIEINGYELVRNKNIKIDPEKQAYFFQSHTELIEYMRPTGIRNGNKGVIFVVDEIHNYFHSHDSKNLPMWVVQVFSQQRKQKLIVLGTVQHWEDVIKSIRTQIDNLIQCKRFWYFVVNYAIDPREIEKEFGQVKLKVKKHGLFFITKKLRQSFDTYKVIDSGREIMGGSDLNIKNYIKYDIKTAKK